MNFFLCNRYNKKSEDNTLNFNSAEILLKNSQNLINNNIIKKIESVDHCPNINIEENNIHTSINNLNNLEEEETDELEIIEYPYSKREKNILNSKIKPKQFNNKIIKFNSPNLIEQDILKQLNNFGINQKSKIVNLNKKEDSKKKINKKTINNNRIIDNEIERKDTMTDPANMAITSFLKDRNKKTEKIKEKNINEENENNFLVLRNGQLKNHLNKNKQIVKPEEKIISKNKLIKTNTKNKSIKNDKVNSKRNVNKNSKSNSKIYSNRGISQNKKMSEYNNSIIKKKNLLKNSGLFSNNKNFAKSLSLSTKKTLPKSYSFNCFINKRKINEPNFSKKDSNKNNDMVYSPTLSKKKYNLFNHIFNDNNNYGNWSSKKNGNNKNKIKITHKKISRTQMKTQKPPLSSNTYLHFININRDKMH